MSTPRWVENVQRTKVGPDARERWKGMFRELRLRFIKVVHDNITLRNTLAIRKRRRPKQRQYEQEREITPGIVADDCQEDLCEYAERKEKW